MGGLVVDALGVGLGGGLTYVGGQLGGLAVVRPDLVRRVLVHPGNAAAVEAVAAGAPVEVVGPGSTARRVVWEQTRMLRHLATDEVLLAPGNVAPLRHPGHQVVLVIQNPNAFGWGRHASWNRSPRRRARIALMRASARRADVVVAVSEAMAADIVGDLPALADRVVVVPDGDATWPPPSSGALPDGLGERPWYLSVAQDWPHKRLDELVAAWAVAAAGDADPSPLVMVGGLSASRCQQQQGLVPAALQRRLHHVGPIADRAVLRRLVEGARALVAPSALEAHPHTPGEAGALGTPVILSDIPAHREVAVAGGDRVRFVPLDDDDALVDALRDPPADRTPWRAGWSWDDHARRLAEVLDRA